jgi:hypothetical protein
MRDKIKAAVAPGHRDAGNTAYQLNGGQAAEVRRRLTESHPNFITLAEAKARLLPDEA